MATNVSSACSSVGVGRASRSRAASHRPRSASATPMASSRTSDRSRRTDTRPRRADAGRSCIARRPAPPVPPAPAIAAPGCGRRPSASRRRPPAGRRRARRPAASPRDARLPRRSGSVGRLERPHLQERDLAAGRHPFDLDGAVARRQRTRRFGDTCARAPVDRRRVAALHLDGQQVGRGGVVRGDPRRVTVDESVDEHREPERVRAQTVLRQVRDDRGRKRRAEHGADRFQHFDSRGVDPRQEQAGGQDVALVLDRGGRAHRVARPGLGHQRVDLARQRRREASRPGRGRDGPRRALDRRQGAGRGQRCRQRRGARPQCRQQNPSSRRSRAGRTARPWPVAPGNAPCRRCDQPAHPGRVVRRTSCTTSHCSAPRAPPGASC